MGATNPHEQQKILRHEEELKKKTISNQLKQAGNFFTNHFSVLSPKFSLAGQYEEKLDLCFPNHVPPNLTLLIKSEILQQGKFIINHYEEKNTFRITIPEDHLSTFKGKKFNFNQPKFKLDTTVTIEKAEEVKTELPLNEELNNPTSQAEATISNQNTNQNTNQTTNNTNQDNDMAKNDLIEARKGILVLFKEKGITTKNYWKIEPASDGISLVINCKSTEDAENINKLLVEANYSSKRKKGKMTVWSDVYAGKVPPKKRTSKKTAAKKVTKKVAVKKAKKTAGKVSVKKSGYTSDNVSAQLRMIADQLEKQKFSNPEALFTRLVGDGELIVRTKNKKGSEVLTNISKEAFLACFK
ncbi:MAG: hypothetical protein WC089_00570 [Candidatus Paceibacterota bacterium]